MSEPGYLKSSCQHCGGHLEFPAEGLGQTIDCPHCGAQTILSPVPHAASRRKFVAIFILLLLILAVTGGVFHWSKKPEPAPPQMPAQTSPPAAVSTEAPKSTAPAPETNDTLTASPVALQKTDGSTLVYAVGTIKNNSGRQRFGVQIELDLLDAQDNKIGTARDYLDVLEPHKNWQFRALLTQSKVVQARVAKIEEQK